MKTWIKRTLIGLASTVVVLGGVAACGNHLHRHAFHMSAAEVTEARHGIVQRVATKLNLSDVQKRKLNVLADEIMAQRTAFRGGDADRGFDVQVLIKGDKFDRARAQTELTQRTQAIQGNGPKVIAAVADFYDSLNPEQQKQVRERLDHRGRWWHRG